MAQSFYMKRSIILAYKLKLDIEIKFILQVIMFVNQINGTAVGFSFFNLFRIDKSSLLTVSRILLMRHWDIHVPVLIHVHRTY